LRLFIEERTKDFDFSLIHQRISLNIYFEISAIQSHIISQKS